MYDKKYCYPNTDVLKNKFNIRDYEKLNSEERFFSLNRLSMLSADPIKGNFDLKHLQNMHKSIFGDIYSWAGEIRTVDIAKDNMFCKSDFINGMADDIFKGIKRDNYLLGTDKEKVIDRLAFYFGEINALHPFREGNGRAQREFIRCMAGAAGYELNYKGITENQMMKVSVESFDMKYDTLKKLLNDNMERMSYKNQLNFCKSISPSSGEFNATYKEYFRYINTITKDIKKNGLTPVDEAVRKVENIHRKAGKELTIKDIHDVIKGKSDITENILKDCEEIGKHFAHQEKMKLEIKDMNLSR